MKRVASFLVACLVSSSVAVSAEPTADDYLNFFKTILGEWNVKYNSGEKTTEGTLSWRLSPTGRCIVSSGSEILQYPAFQALDGYDPELKKWKWSGFNAAGEHWVAHGSTDVASLKSGLATFKFDDWIVVKPDGTKETWRGELTITTGKDQWKQVFTNQTLDGQKQPDEEYVYERRKTPSAPSPLPKEIARELNYFVGDWSLEGNGARGPMKSSWSMKWAPGKHCLIVEYAREEPGNVVRGNGVWSWDSASGEIVYHAAYSDSGLEHIRTKIDKSGVFEGKYSGSLEGKPLDAECELRKEPPDQWTFKTRGISAAGAGELDVRFTRVKRTAVGNQPKK